MSEKENSNVIVIQDNEEKKTHKLTWSSYIKGICNYKWWIIGATALTTFAGFAGVQWGINAFRETLSVSYSYNLATEISQEKTERFINGEVFDYSSVVTKKAFEYVKASDSAFSELDIDKLYEKGGIIVTRNINTDYDNEITYTLSAKAKLFSNVEVGKKFMNVLINYPVVQSLNAINNYSVTSVIDENFNSLTYVKKGEILKKQYNFINEAYTQIKTKFGASVAVDEKGKTLTQAMSDFDSKASDIPTLVDSIYSNGFVDYEEGKETERIAQIKADAESTIITLETKKEQRDTKLALLNSMQSATIVSTLTNESEYVKEMINLKNQIEAISDEIKTLVLNLNWAGFFENSEHKFVFDDTDETNACYHLANTGTLTEWVAANAAFSEKLSSSSKKLQDELKNANDAFHYSYGFNNSITIWGSGSVSLVNSIPWAVGLVGGLVLGFVVSSLIAGTVEGSKTKEEK